MKNFSGNITDSREMVSVRTYRQEDFREVLELLNECLDKDIINESLLKEKLYDDPGWEPHSCFISEADGRINGFLQTVHRIFPGKKMSYVKLFGVLPGYRRKGIGSALLANAEKRSREKGSDYIRLFDSPLNYFMPGLDPAYTPAVCFAAKNGFSRFDVSVNMSADLSVLELDTGQEVQNLVRQGIVIRRVLQEDHDSLLELVKNEWPLWLHEVNVAMNNTPGSVFVALKSKRVLAFSAYDANNRGTGWFGPMGTHPELRAMGIGGILLRMCLEDIREQGHPKVIIPWVDPVKFYSDYIGARISRVFWRYEKKL